MPDQQPYSHYSPPEHFRKVGAVVLGLIAGLAGISAASGFPLRDGSWQFREPVGIPVATPLVLLDSPAQALSETAPALAAKGVRGVICFAGNSLPISAGERASLRAIRNLLDTLGLEGLFFRTTPLDTAESGLRIFERFAGEVDRLARTAKWCGANGLWLDLPATAAIFRLDHPLPETELIRAGRRIYAAAARRFPDAELLVYGGHDPAPGPRWRAVLEGLFEGAGVADRPRITVVRALNSAPLSPGEIAAAAGSVARMTAGSFSLPNRERWERIGGSALLLDAATYAGLGEEPNNAVQAFRIARDFVLAVSDRWAVFLPENRTGGTLETGPTLRLVSPLQGLNRLGTLENDPRAPGQILRVFEHDGHLALLFPDGLTDTLEIPGPYRICASVPLAEGIRTFHLARNGKVLIPPHPGPLLVTGLPGIAEVFRAGWSWAVDPPLEAGPRRLNFMASWTNRTGLTRQGALVAIPGSRWSLGAASMPFQALPGQTVTLRRTLQGVARPGDFFSAQLLLLEPGLSPITRTISVPVFPRQMWILPLDGPCLPGRVLLDAESLDTLRVVAAAERSGPLCFDADGAVMWHSLESGPWLCGPEAISAGGQTLIAMGSRQGNIVFWDARSGVKLGSVMLDGTPARALTAANPDSLIALTDRGTLYGMEAIRKVWVVDAAMDITRICPTPSGEITLVCGAVGGRGAALGLRSDGSIRWRAELPGVPILAEPGGSKGWWIGFGDGRIAELDAGGSLYIVNPPIFTAPLKALAMLPAVLPGSMPRPKQPDCPILPVAVDRRGLVTFMPGQAPLVVMPHRSLQWLHPEPAAGVLMAGTADGTLYCLDPAGRVLWYDSRPWGVPRWVLVRPTDRQRLAVIAAFADGVIRAWDGGPLPKRK